MPRKTKTPDEVKAVLAEGVLLAAHQGVLGGVHSAVGNGATKKQIQQALFMAAGHGHTEVVAYLAGAGGNVNLPDAQTTMTPLHAATAFNHIPTVRTLLDLGADPKAKDRDGASPELYAHKNGYKTLSAVFKHHAERKAHNERELQELLAAHAPKPPER